MKNPYGVEPKRTVLTIFSCSTDGKKKDFQFYNESNINDAKKDAKALVDKGFIVEMFHGEVLYRTKDIEIWQI